MKSSGLMAWALPLSFLMKSILVSIIVITLSPLASGALCDRILHQQKTQLAPSQIQAVVEAVRKSLPYLKNDKNVLPPLWLKMNLESKVDSTGFCFAAANAVYHLLGGKASGLTPMVAKYFDPELLIADPQSKGMATHWWIRDSAGNIIDPTSDQYTALGLKPPYELGKGAGFNTPLTVPTKAGRKIMDYA